MTDVPGSQSSTTPSAATAASGPHEHNGAGSVGKGAYIVRQGDCISSIAKQTGHFWEKIWNDSGNAELKEARKDPNVLLPGDRVAIPGLETKQEAGETEMRHRFVRRGEPSFLRLVLRRDGEPRANERYTLIIDDREFTGVTDPDGKLEHPIPGDATEGRLIVGEDEYPLLLGSMNPKTEVSGAQARLNNLGYEAGEPDGTLTPRTVGALKAFQNDFGLPVTGELDEQTQDKLVEAHGS